MELKKFTSLDELLLSEEFRKKDLSYCDLSGIDLSSLSEETWFGFMFDHTDFSNTNIKFYPQELKKVYDDYRYKNCKVYLLEYCNFTNCDLSYLGYFDFLNTSIKGSNFTNTNLLDFKLVTGFGCDVGSNSQRYKDYSDVVFDQSEYMIEAIKRIGFLGNDGTIKKNSFVPFPSSVIYCVIKKRLPNIDSYISSEKIEEYNIYIDELLKEDEKREGKLVKFFNILNDNCPFSELERVHFFQGVIGGKVFSEIDLSDIPGELIEKVVFNKCNFKKIIFPENFENRKFNAKTSSISNVYFPTLQPNLWTNIRSKRLGNSRITIYRNLYLELGRFCNGKCKFCRNQYLEPCSYNFENIKNNTALVRPYLDYIVVGGGEPTLNLKDVVELKDYVALKYRECYGQGNYPKWIINTNASADLDELAEISFYFSYNISRHSVDDSINNKILGVHAFSAEELKKLKELQDRKKSNKSITLCATCFKGDGIDTVEKLEDYIALSDECGISQIMFQTLHKDLNSFEQVDEVLPIEDEIFDEMIIKLEEQGYKIGIPIYSTGDYKLIIAKKGDKTISFKKYITKEELEREWYQACKRTFDLSMDPSGNVYQNWHQSSGKVLLKSQGDR